LELHRLLLLNVGGERRGSKQVIVQSLSSKGASLFVWLCQARAFGPGLGFKISSPGPGPAQALCRAWPGSGLPGPGLAGLAGLRQGRGHHYPAPSALTARPAIAHQVDLGRPPAADHVPLGSAALGRGKADTLLPELLRPACLRPIRPN
jgi:hypothetical protein